MTYYLTTYLFYPNPGHLTYGSWQIVALFALSGGLIAASVAIRFWRKSLTSGVTKKLSRSWSSVTFWFGLTGLLLTVSRVEKIQFLAMRFAWIVWAAFLILAVVVQYKMFRMRHYEVLPRAEAPEDPRSRYLPGKKK